MKIETSTIENYANMTAEEKVSALENFDYDDHSADSENWKKQFDNASHEIATLKKKAKELETQANDGEQTANKQLEELQATVAKLEKEKSISDLTAKFVSTGYSEELAKKRAEAQLNGDFDTAFETEKQFNEEREKSLKAELLKNTPTPKNVSGAKPSEMTLEKFRKLDPIARAQFSTDYPDEYKALYGGK